MQKFDTRHYYPCDIELSSLVSSNATEDDRPGPGRILGNIYSGLGRRLEELFNSLAERRGYGPRAVAIRVRERNTNWLRRADHLGYPPVQYTRETAHVQRKDISKLIRYSRCVANYVLRRLSPRQYLKLENRGYSEAST